MQRQLECCRPTCSANTTHQTAKSHEAFFFRLCLPLPLLLAERRLASHRCTVKEWTGTFVYSSFVSIRSAPAHCLDGLRWNAKPFVLCKRRKKWLSNRRSTMPQLRMVTGALVKCCWRTCNRQPDVGIRKRHRLQLQSGAQLFARQVGATSFLPAPCTIRHRVANETFVHSGVGTHCRPLLQGLPPKYCHPNEIGGNKYARAMRERRP